MMDERLGEDPAVDSTDIKFSEVLLVIISRISIGIVRVNIHSGLKYYKQGKCA